MFHTVNGTKSTYHALNSKFTEKWGHTAPVPDPTGPDAYTLVS
jgi:hypothetical protein